MPEKNTLAATEFAIEDGTLFRESGKRMTFTKNGVLTLTITYLIDDMKKLQMGPGNIVANYCGVLKESSSLSSGSVGNLNLITGSTQVFFRSPKNEIDLLTDGEKGNHGHQVFSPKKGTKKTKRK